MLKMTARWVDSPEDVFIPNSIDWARWVMDSLYLIMVEEADNVQQFMRANAIWHDDVDPTREYLKARAFRNDADWQVGIEAYYDEAVYRAKGGKSGDFGIGHETKTFARVGVIAIILPRRPNTVLGDEAPRIFDRVRAVVGDMGGSVTP